MLDMQPHPNTSKSPEDKNVQIYWSIFLRCRRRNQQPNNWKHNKIKQTIQQNTKTPWGHSNVYPNQRSIWRGLLFQPLSRGDLCSKRDVKSKNWLTCFNYTTAVVFTMSHIFYWSLWQPANATWSYLKILVSPLCITAPANQSNDSSQTSCPLDHVCSSST